MPYPNGFNSYGFGPIQYPQQAQQPINGYIQVAGIEGARAYYMPPNSKAPLFDSNKDVFYDVSTDANGQKTIHTVPFQYPQDDEDDIYATKDDLRQIEQGMQSLNGKFDKIWEALNGQQSVSEA